VPFDVAFSLSPTARLAWIAALGTLKGGVFDWQEMQWHTR
jgi:hypothetical protein